jgi:hypothetical protein
MCEQFPNTHYWGTTGTTKPRDEGGIEIQTSIPTVEELVKDICHDVGEAILERYILNPKGSTNRDIASYYTCIRDATRPILKNLFDNSQILS